MARAGALPTPDFRHALLETYAVNDRMNQLILEQLDPQAWRAKPPGRNARTIAAIFGPEGRVKQFLRDGWSRPWPGGAAMFVYMVVHDAHHRGQVCMLAHQLGFPIKAGYKMWVWERLWKQCGFTHPR